MPFSFECLSTRSGKALVLAFDNQKYLFNCFEGFQRYSIQSKTKLLQLSTVHLPTKYSVIPFLGAFLTLADMGKQKINIITLHEEIFHNANTFVQRPKVEIRFHIKDFEDNNLKIRNIEDGVYLNAILEIKPIRGKFNKELAELHNIPKRFWNQLCDGKTVHVDDKVYEGREYLSDEYTFDKIAIIFNENDIENLTAYENIQVIFCFHSKVANIIAKEIKAVFYVLGESDSIEFVSLYKILKELNTVYKNFHVPMGNHVPVKDNTFELLYSNDQLLYSKEERRIIFFEGQRDSYDSKHVDIDSKHNIVFLGTGSAIPSKYRNVSAILVQHNEDFVVLDCGEDTYFNIIRFYGNDDVIVKIDTIYISHSHADHHLGLSRLITEILKKRDNINVICPSSVMEFVKQYVEEGITFYPTDGVERPKSKFIDAFFDLENHLLRFDLKFEVLVTPVSHCADSCGVRFNFEDFSLSYSGDCRPSTLFALLSRSVDIMIHEATFDDDFKDKALKTKHSTISEAVNIFKQSKAGKLILTHFSQRYPKNIKYDGIIPAFDFFRYDVDNFDEELFNECTKYLNELK